MKSNLYSCDTITTMKLFVYSIVLVFLFYGCSYQPEPSVKSMPNTPLQQSSFDQLPQWSEENYVEVLDVFRNNCKSSRTQKIYADLCRQVYNVQNPQRFLENHFIPYKIVAPQKKPLLTGYYEPELHGSLKKSKKYLYPLYETPKDMISVELSSIYPELKNYRLRGRLEGNKLIPYYTRKEIESRDINATAICYVDSKIDKFFLEVQGSGRVKLDNNTTIFVGYDNQNGHRYRSIGKYLIEQGEIPKEKMSLQAIKKWCDTHPKKIDQLLHYNKSLIFFKKRNYKATGSLGVELTPMRSVAVDRGFIPLGSMLYIDAKGKDSSIQRVVFAQDTGGAIKGAIRADLFTGFGDQASELAGKLQSDLTMWVFLPKKEEK